MTCSPTRCAGAPHLGEGQGVRALCSPLPLGEGQGVRAACRRLTPSWPVATPSWSRSTETAESRRQLEREKDRLAKAASQAEAKALQAEADLTDWRTQWTAAVKPLGLPGDSTPVAVNEVLVQTAELLARLKEAASFSERIDGIGREALCFRQNVERLLQAVDPDHPPPGDRFQEAFEELLGRLRRAMTDQKNFESLCNRSGSSRRRSGNRPTRVVETLRARLAVLCQEARCQGPEELPAAEAASAEVLRLRQERESCHAQLLELAAGATIDALMAEAAAISPDSIPGELQQIADAMSDLERTRGELREKMGTIRNRTNCCFSPIFSRSSPRSALEVGHCIADLLQLARQRVGGNRGRLGHQGVDRRPRGKFQQLGVTRFPLLPQAQGLCRGRFGHRKLIGALATGLLVEYD